MKKITLFLWIIFLLSESCYDNRLDLGNKAVTPFIPFGIEDARQYFEKFDEIVFWREHRIFQGDIWRSGIVPDLIPAEL